MDKRVIGLTSCCGLITFFTNTLFYEGELLPIVIFACVILPGFTFGGTLTYTVKDVAVGKRLLFIILSGGIYIAAVWIATDNHIPGYNFYFYLYASVFGHCSIYLLYQLLLIRSRILFMDIFLSVAFGILSSILPMVAYNQHDLISPARHFFNTLLLMSIFFTWQFLFGLLLVFSRRRSLQHKS